ncbi:hypothetical protein [Companilactobacillus baiquanensis]|uniref:Cell surface protein n=1 Tax=Companilactobacillus baiquanensis TaxID=2486005 RepID=A0ABW1UV49_9LACO|nr:hypothetical protein [Companilactobacillus baiquanensis]
MQTKKIVKRLLTVLFAMVAFFGILQRTSTIVKAGASYNDSDVLNKQPAGGLSIAKYFTPGTFSGNKATVKQNSNGKDYVQLTDTINKGVQTSAVWSNNDKNYINTDQKQTLSMWAYFGTEPGNLGVPDGMAFVLQNGGTDAISNLNGTPNAGETLGVWGSDSNKYAMAKSPRMNNVPTLAEQAIQNSFAIEFDTYTNHFKGDKTVTYSDWKYNSGSLPDATNAFDFLAYNYYNGNSNFLYANNDSQRSHIAWNYPARDDTYIQLATPNIFQNSVVGMIHNLGTGTSQAELDENGANVYLQKELSNSTDPLDSWRHITIQYTPADTGSTNATLTYKVGDKNPVNGKSKKPITDVTLSLDMTAFNLSGSHKLRYGFTASTGANSPTNSAVIFETMPSLVNAEVNAYTVDKTTKSRVQPANKDEYDPTQANQNDSLVDDESLGLALTSRVHPKDDLTLNYMFHYLSGEEPATGLKETINVPDNVTVSTDSSGNIGKVYYTSKKDADGNTKTKEVDIPAGSLSGNVLTCDMDDAIGDPDSDNWEYARVELNATANDLPDGTTKLTVPSTTTSFEGDNYKANADSTAFDIVKPADTLIITATSPLTSDLELGSSTNLTGDISLKSGDAINKSDMYISTTIDDGEPILSQDSSSGNGFTIPILSDTTADIGVLTEGEHTIKIHVIDSNFQTADGVDTLISNELVYKVNVTNKKVVITPDDSNITVNDNEPLILSGSYLHSDDTTTSDEGGNSKISYTITNDDGTKQDAVTENQTNNGKYAFTLKPYAYDKDEATSLDDYTGTTGLKVGKNTITINIVDQDGHKSDSKDVIVNVPDIKPTLTTTQNEFNVIQDDLIDLNADVNYDNDYQVTPSKLTWNMDVNGNKSIKSYSGDTPLATPISQEFSIESTKNGMDDEAQNPYKISVYYTDPYGRKSNTLDYSINIINKTATIENSDYKFQSVHAINTPKRVKREGNWNLKVDSVMTKWTLTAKAGEMVKDAGTADEAVLDGDLVFVSKDNTTHDLSTQTFIQSDSDDSDQETTDVAGNWSSDQGVLLDLNSRNVSGSYTGKIQWGLTDSV